MTIAIRPERAGDEPPISELITRAFTGAAHASGNEAEIVGRLRRDGELSAAFVAIDVDAIIGQVAFSPVRISEVACGWFGLGPVAVEPSRQGEGIGAALVAHGLSHLRAIGGRGCVVLGEPTYYGRFGFVVDPALRYPPAPAEFFQCLAFADAHASGIVSYARAFG